MNSMEQKKVLLGFTASVGSILAPKIVKAYKDAGFYVGVICTPKTVPAFTSAQELAAAGADGFYSDNDEWSWSRSARGADITPGIDTDGKEIYFTHRWQKNDEVVHIELRDRFDMLVVAPITANTLAKMAHGLCDNLLTSILLAWNYDTKPVVIAPAMNTQMWESKMTQRNLSTVMTTLQPNIHLVNPIEKILACGDMGMGGLAKIEDILSTSLKALENK